MKRYFDEETDVEREPRTLPDMYIEQDALCGVCGVQNSPERPMSYVCSVCHKPTHDECGDDTEPSGGWDRDYDVNYWVCSSCLKKDDPHSLSSGETDHETIEQHLEDAYERETGIEPEEL